MKKILLILIIILGLFTIKVNALSECTKREGCSIGTNYYVSMDDMSPSSAFVHFKYSITNYSNAPVFCLDANNWEPHNVNKYYSLSTENISAIANNKLQKSLIAIYRAYLLAGGGDGVNLAAANEAMRILVVRTGNVIYGGNCSGVGISGFSGEAERLAKAENLTSNLERQRFYCVGAKAYGHNDAKLAGCVKVLKNYDMDLLMQNNYSIQLIEDTTKEQKIYDNSLPFSREISIKLGGTGYENIKKLFKKYSSLKSKSSITVKSCDVDSSSKSKGFECTLLNNNGVNLLNGNQSIIISNKNNVTSSNTVKVTISYDYNFPFDASSLTLFTCEGGDCRDNSPYCSSNTQRMLVVDTNKKISDVKFDINVQTKGVCSYETDKNGKPVYKYDDKVITEKEYYDKGCGCNGENPNLLEEPSSLEYYEKYCQSEDIIKFENECSLKSRLRSTKSLDNPNASATCTKDEYVDYTKSYIKQISMDKVMERVNKLEDSEAYMTNIGNLYSNEGISNYFDRSYLTNSITGKDGNTLKPISAGNNYCMLYTSEKNDLYFPGTAVATSGRFFVFTELNREECLNSINPSANCFRQPYIDGTINLTMHTNFQKWEKDYLAAIAKENEYYRNASDHTKKELDDVTEARKLLETFKQECESHNSITNYWTYNIEPSLEFTYRQKGYEGNKIYDDIQTVKMTVSTTSEKYWPNVSTNARLVSSNGRRSAKNYQTRTGTMSFDTNENYTAEYQKTIYFRPEKATYAVLGTGQSLLIDTTKKVNTTIIENGIPVGYVYTTRLTAYQGAYSTSFKIDNVGHLGLNNSSNIQRSLNKYKEDNNITDLSSECVYCHKEYIQKRDCDKCPDPSVTPIVLRPAYIFRQISLSDVTPHDRTNTNWSDLKGKTAEASIQSLSGENIISALNNNDEKVSITTLDNSNKKIEMMELANDTIYNDSSKEYLEYEFTLSTNDMEIIRKNNRRDSFDYGTVNVCKSTNTTTTNHAKSADADYCFVCNDDGKECKSTFIDAFGESAITANARLYKWKYFINNKWYRGSWSNIINSNPEIKKLSGFESGIYPDPVNQDAFLKIYTNWP